MPPCLSLFNDNLHFFFFFFFLACDRLGYRSYEANLFVTLLLAYLLAHLLFVWAELWRMASMVIYFFLTGLAGCLKGFFFFFFMLSVHSFGCTIPCPSCLLSHSHEIQAP